MDRHLTKDAAGPDRKSLSATRHRTLPHKGTCQHQRKSGITGRSARHDAFARRKRRRLNGDWSPLLGFRRAAAV